MEEIYNIFYTDPLEKDENAWTMHLFRKKNIREKKRALRKGRGLSQRLTLNLKAGNLMEAPCEIQWR